jgi:hypothetical protein
VSPARPHRRGTPLGLMLPVDIAVIFRAVTRWLSRLAVPIAACSSLWALLTLVFGCLYRIADGPSSAPLFHGSGGGSGGAIRIDFSDAINFSVVTLSTVGNGDILPLDDGIWVLASIQMLLLFGFIEIMRGSRSGMPDGTVPDAKNGHGSASSRIDHSQVAGVPGHGAATGERRAVAGE